MLNMENVKGRLKRVFSEEQASVLAEIIVKARDELVKVSDFNELKEIVRDLAKSQKELAEAQKRTEARVEELAEAQGRTEQRLNSLAQRVEELAEAQKRTEARVEELAEAQKRTEEEIKRLARGLVSTRTELGGLARSVSYSLENEAYRALPSYLKRHYGIEVLERFIRTEIDGEEIDIFAKAKMDGKDVLIVGETELKLSSVGKLKRLDKKVLVVKEKFAEKEIVKLFVTHYARPQIKKKAEERGIIIVQSFEW